MDKRVFGGLLVLAAALLLGICNTIIPTAFGFAAMLGILLAIGIAVWMLLSCKSLDVMADISAALTGCIWGVLLGISLMAGWLKLLTKRSMHPYDEGAYGIICVVSLLLALIVWGFDIARNEKKTILSPVCAAGKYRCQPDARSYGSCVYSYASI